MNKAMLFSKKKWIAMIWRKKILNELRQGKMGNKMIKGKLKKIMDKRTYLNMNEDEETRCNLFSKISI